MRSFRAGIVTGAVLVGGGLAAAAWVPKADDDTATLITRQPAASVDDVAMVQTVLAEARGSSMLMCEMASGIMRGNFWWRGREPVDEDVNRVLDWTRGDLDNPAVVPVLVSGMADGDPCVARTAARLLGRTEAPAATEALLDALEDTAATVREMGALGLGVSEPDGAFDPLVKATESDPAPAVRIMAAWALGQLEMPEAIDPLSRALASDDVELRAVSVMALGEIEHRDALPALLRALTDPAARVRTNAAWALGELEAPEAIAPLSKALLEDADPGVRRSAARALGEIDS